MKKYLEIRVSGQVQGVFFRHHTAQKARELSLAGFVRNEPDGSVYIEAEGDENALAELLRWCQSGPPTAQVSQVKAQEGVLKNYSEFRAEL